MKNAILRLAFAALLLPAVARAQDSPVTIRGFVSQGYLKSSANNYLTVPTKEGSFAYNEAALNFTVEPLPNLRVGAQLFSRDLGAQGNNRVSVDWAMGDYRFHDWLGVRAGRIKLPAGLYNTLVDADVARPEILQPNGVYSLNTRDIAAAFDGGDVYGRVAVGAGGALEYEAFGGTMNLDGAYIVTRLLETGAANSLPGLAAIGLKKADYSVGDIKANMKHIYGGLLEWQPPVRGLRVRVAVNSSDSSFSDQTTYTGYMGPAPVSIAVRVGSHYRQKYQLFFSTEYQRGNLRLTAEHYRAATEISTTITGLPFTVPTSADKPFGCYGQAAYRFHEKLQASAYYSVSYLSRDDKDGRQFVQRGQSAHRAWQKELVFTGRADLDAHWLLKAEVHFVDGTFAVSGLDNPGGLQKNWTLFALKTTIHF
jgi:hypothetical protein